MQSSSENNHMLLSKQLLNMCALFKNVGKVITTQNSGRQPVQREFSLSLRDLMWPQPRLDHRNPAVDWCRATLKKDPRQPRPPHQTCTFENGASISHHFLKERVIWRRLAYRPDPQRDRFLGMKRQETQTGRVSEKFHLKSHKAIRSRDN